MFSWATGWWVFMMSWSWLAAFLSSRQFKVKRRPKVNRSDLPSVSLLRPLKDLEPGLEENLTACFSMDYPKFEILISVADMDDPAAALARKVAKRFPKVDCQILQGIEENSYGPNPKIQNLTSAYSKAKYDIVWICDSNICVEPDTLLHAAPYFLDKSVGVVHHAPEGVGARSFGGKLEQMFLNTAHTKIYLVFNYLNVASCVIGKSMLFRKSVLRKATGGLAPFGKYLAEDNAIATVIRNAGLSHVLSHKTAVQPLNQASLSDYWKRRSRWTRIRAYSMPVVTLIEPFTESIVCGLVGAWGFQDLIDWRVFLTAHFAMWLLADFLIIRGLPYAFQWSQAGELFVIWLMRELSAIPIYIWTVLFDSNRVVWRGRTYKLLMGGTVIEQDNDVNNSSKLFSGVGLLGRFPVDLMLFVVSLLLRPIFMFTSTPKQNLSNTSDRMIVDQQDCVYETAEYSE